MKRIILLFAVICLALLSSCDPHSAMTPIDPPDGCHVYIEFDHDPYDGGTTHTYSGVYVGLETQSNYDNWELYDYDLLVSQDGQSWEATNKVEFTVPKADTEYYLRIIGYSICRKNGYVYRSTSISTIRALKGGGEQNISSVCYIEAVD